MGVKKMSAEWKFTGSEHEYKQEKHGGLDVIFWSNGGTASMNVNGDGTFSAEWDGRPDRNILFRSGRIFGFPAEITLNHEQIGEISMNFNASHTTSINSFLCVYGWTVQSTMEYYIIESWGSYQKGRNSPQAVFAAQYEIPNEGIYDLFVSHERVNQPSVFSKSDTFPQYMAIRTERRTSGIISVSEHFRQWEAAGLVCTQGALYETALCVESWGSAGEARINSFNLSIAKK
jgi:endo-1,4-beta-xylanase